MNELTFVCDYASIDELTTLLFSRLIITVLVCGFLLSIACDFWSIVLNSVKKTCAYFYTCFMNRKNPKPPHIYKVLKRGEDNVVFEDREAVLICKSYENALLIKYIMERDINAPVYEEEADKSPLPAVGDDYDIDDDLPFS